MIMLWTIAYYGCIDYFKVTGKKLAIPLISPAVQIIGDNLKINSVTGGSTTSRKHGIEVVKKSVYQYIENCINNYLFGNYNISEVRSNLYNNLAHSSQLGTEDLNSETLATYFQELNFNIIKYCEETYPVQSQYSIDFESETETSNKGKHKLKQYSKTIVTKTNPFVVRPAATISGPSVKKRSIRVLIASSIGGGSTQNVKKSLSGVKLSSADKNLKDSGSVCMDGQFASMDMDEEVSDGNGASNSQMNTFNAKCFNTGAAISSLISTISYDMDDKEEVEVTVKKSFALDINLSVVEEKSAMAKTQVIRKLFSTINSFGGATTPSKFEGIIQSTFTLFENMKKAMLLARENNIIVNSDLKRQGVHSDWTVVIKKISMNMPKKMIIAAVSKFGQVVSIRVQLIELWQKTVADQLAVKWSFLIRKDLMCMAKTYRVFLFTLPVGTTAHDLGNLLVGAGGKTCVINRFLDTGNRVCCAVICFENDEELESAFCMEPIFGGVKLFWVRLDMVWCERPAVFSSKSWAQVVSLVSSSNGSHFGFGPGFSSFSGVSGVVGHLSPVGPVSSFLETRLTFLEHSLELFTDKVSGIIDKLDSLNLVPLALASSSQPLVVPGSVNVEFGSDMVLDKLKSAVPPPSLVFSGASSLGSSSSKILTSKVGCLESKLMALEALVCSVLEKLDQMCADSGSAVSSIATCNVRRMNNLAKQEDIIYWHRDMNNLVSIVTETKLKDKVWPWIANKFDGVQVFVSGLDSGYLGSGVVIIMNNALAKHVCKVFEVPGCLLSVKLLFKNKLSVLILDLYTDASVSVCFSQVDEINFLIAKAVNESSFMILGGNFNEDGSHRCASFRKCFDLGLVNALGGSLFGKNATWTNSRGVTKTIDYVFVSSSLVNAILNHSVTRVDEYFDTDHRAVTVSVDLGGLLDVNLMSFHKQTNKNRWKFNFKDTTAAKWAAFKESSTATMAMFKSNDVFKKKWLKSYDNVFTKESSKFHKLELLVSKLVKASHLISSEEFVALLGMWNSLDTTNASVVESFFLSGSHFEVIRSVLFRVKKLYRSSKLSESKCAKEFRIRSVVSRRIKSFEVNKGHTIRSVLEHLFHKMVLDHLVVDDKLVLDSSLVKSKVDIIMEDWTRKCELVTDISADWCHQYQLLMYVFDDVFLRIMDPISSVELFGIVSDLPNDKAAGLSSISNEL
ncbi:hypothetical protein G9A89_021927 [Geosiphon pyriformis]|nr:hypothetical protein G9A89_021927 [Geosiphon pyriformis]